MKNGNSVDVLTSKEEMKKVRLGKWSKRLEKISPYLFITPFLIFFFTFTLLPTILNVGISFLNWDYYDSPTFAGLNNFKNLFLIDQELGGFMYQFSEEFWKAILATLLFVAIEAPILVIFPFLIALLLNRKAKGTKFFKAIFYFPAILSVATVGIIWNYLLDTNMGLINIIFNSEVPWITKQPFAWVSIFLMSTWWGIGGNMILFLAGLQDVPKDLYEAAEISGASRFQKMIYITIPCLRNTFIYVVIMTIISCFNVFGQPMMLTNGGPNESTTVGVMYIYNVAFGGYKFGRASAMSLILAVMMIIFSVISFNLRKEKFK